MPVINNPARQMGKNVVTELTDSVGTSDITYTFSDPQPQETFKIQNLGSVALFVTVGSQLNVQIAAFKDKEIPTEPFTSFKIRSQSGQGSFRITTSYKSVDEEDEKDLLSLIQGLLAQAPSGRDKIVCFGDSITEGGTTGRRYPLWLSYITGSNVINKGVSGNKLEDLIARITTDVINLKPSVCIVMAGTNNVNTGETLASMSSKMAQITDTLLTNGITPIWGTIPPRADIAASFNTTIRKLNDWLVAHCQAKGIAMVDFYKVIADANGNPKVGYLMADNLHPTVLGMVEIAKEVAKATPTSPRKIPWRLSGSNSETIVPNGAFETDSNADGLADSWQTMGSGGSLLSWRIEKHPDDGNWQVCEKKVGTSNQSGGVRVPLSLTVGATYRIEADFIFQCTPLDATDDPYTIIYGEFYDGANALIGSYQYVLYETHLNGFEKIRAWADVTVPTGTVTSRIVAYSIAKGSFIQKLGRVKATELYSAV